MFKTENDVCAVAFWDLHWNNVFLLFCNKWFHMEVYFFLLKTLSYTILWDSQFQSVILSASSFSLFMLLRHQIMTGIAGSRGNYAIVMLYEKKQTHRFPNVWSLIQICLGRSTFKCDITRHIKAIRDALNAWISGLLFPVKPQKLIHLHWTKLIPGGGNRYRWMIYNI